MISFRPGAGAPQAQVISPSGRRQGARFFHGGVCTPTPAPALATPTGWGYAPFRPGAFQAT